VLQPRTDGRRREAPEKKAFGEAGIEHEIVRSPDEQLELVITARLSAERSSNLPDD